MNSTVEVLIFAHNGPDHEVAAPPARDVRRRYPVRLWHNGDAQEALQVVRPCAEAPGSTAFTKAARTSGSVADWAQQEHESAVAVHAGSLDLREYAGWRFRRRNLAKRARRLLRRRGCW